VHCQAHQELNLILVRRHMIGRRVCALTITHIQGLRFHNVSST
jgi:hypothetical protein